MRNKIFQMEARVLEHEVYPEAQHVMRIAAKEIASTAKPGSFIHIKYGDKFNLRRPISIMGANKENGTVDILFKEVGKGTTELAKATRDDSLNLLGPIGQSFKPEPDKLRSLLIGGGVGMPPMIFLAEDLKQQGLQPMVMLGSEVEFPFANVTTGSRINGIPAEINFTMAHLEALNINARCASLKDFPGVYKGFVTDLARLWLDSLGQAEIEQVVIYSCGPHPMLEAVHNLAVEFNLPCQVSLEEYMACGVGGCAGCVVRVQEGNTQAMRRVCVDGPVFESRAVF